MYDYLKALHARSCQEPELQKVRAELDQAYREINARLGQQDRSSSFRELHNDMTHVLKRPCSGREECRKVSTSWPRLSRAV